MPLKKIRKKCIYNNRRYWYHVSTTIRGNKVKLTPLSSDSPKCFNRAYDEPEDERICVAPSVAHCLTAIPYYPHSKFRVYRTKSPVKASRPKKVPDSFITQEGWIQKPTKFIKIGTLSLKRIESKTKKDIIPEAATNTEDLTKCRKVLKWWQKIKVNRFIKRT